MFNNRKRLREKKTVREKLNMPFWRQQLREEISLAQVILDWGLRPTPPDPASNATSQDTGQRHAQTHKSIPKLWLFGTLENGLSPGTPWHSWGGPHLPDLESGMSTGMPWHPWRDLHFSPEPQHNPTRVVPMMGSGFQPPGPCPGHKLGT